MPYEETHLDHEVVGLPEGASDGSVGQGEVLALPLRHYLAPGHALTRGNRCSHLRDGVEAFPAMIAAIQGAREYVRLETYMFIDDSVGQLFARHLSEAAERGVSVSVLYDAVGSLLARRSFFAGLASRGVEIRAFRPFSGLLDLKQLFRRDHRKILVVDGRVAFVGGVNIAAQWAPSGTGGGWRDDVVRIEGPAVRRLERCFRSSWRLQLGRRLKPASPRPRLASVWPMDDGATSGPRLDAPGGRGTVDLSVLTSRRSIHRAYLHAIERAKTSVAIAAGYFIPDRRLVQALKSAARRGVEVRLLLSGKTDHPVLRWAGRAFWGGLLEAGVKIYEWNRGVLHAKTAVVDGVWGTAGSFNLEWRSLLFNFEVNIAFEDPAWGKLLGASLEADCREARLVSRDSWGLRPAWHRLVEAVCYFFRKLL